MTDIDNSELTSNSNSSFFYRTMRQNLTGLKNILFSWYTIYLPLRSTGLRNTYDITQSRFLHYLYLFLCRIIIYNQKVRRASAFEGLGKPLPANQAHLGRRAELAGRGLPSPSKPDALRIFWL